MAKLTKKQRNTLDRALSAITQASEYIFSDDVAVCCKKESQTTTQDYIRFDGGGPVLACTQREYGSHLCRLRDAEKLIRDMIVLDQISRLK